MTQRPPFLTLLASLTAHVAAVGLLFLLTSNERAASALVVDLSELESPSQKPGPMSAPASGAHPAGRATAAGSAPSPPAAQPLRRSARVETAPPTVAAPAPSIPEPQPPRVSDVAPVAPEPRPNEPLNSPAEPVAEAARVAAPVETAPSASGGAAVTTNPPASPDQTSQISAGGVGRATSGPRGTTTGSGVALAPVGPSGKGGTGGSEYGPYYRQIRQRIQETLGYPAAARRRGITGTVLLELLIKPDGAISAVVKESSSHRVLDDAALETVRNLPRQPFPAGLVPRQLTVPLPVMFDLK